MDLHFDPVISLSLICLPYSNENGVFRYNEIRKLSRGGNPTDDLNSSNERHWLDAIFLALPFTKVFLRLIII